MKRIVLARNKGKKLEVHKALDNNVVIIKMFPGSVKPCCLLFGIPGLKGIVLETYGSGNAPTEDWFMALLVKAINNGLHVVNVTQCSGEA
jgi:L-asparaginase